jgi:hypothetical protein
VIVIVIVVVAGVVMSGGDRGDDDATATGSTTAATEAAATAATTAPPAPTTQPPSSVKVASVDDCWSPAEVNEGVIGGLLPEGRLLSTEERVTDNYDWGHGIQAEEAYPVCSYRYEDYRYTATYVSPGGDTATGSSTADIKLEYGRFAPTVSSPGELLSDAFENLSASMFDESDGSQLHDVQLLGYQDTSSFVYVEGSAYAYYYIDGDSLCVGYASAGGSDLSAWANVAAHQLAARVACDLDVDVPESPEDTADTGLSPGTTVAPSPGTTPSGCVVESDADGYTWNVCPDGTREPIGGGM